MDSVILDTNVFVAAGFNRDSHSARILARIRAGELRLVWNDETRRETKTVLSQIPMLSWKDVASLFRSDARYERPTQPEAFAVISDQDDRKFAALAYATAVPLVTADNDLLAERSHVDVVIMTPREFSRQSDGS